MGQILGTISIGPICSVLTLLYTHHRDKRRMKTSSRYFPEYKDEWSYSPETFYVKIVNAGKQPIILDCLRVKYDDGSIGGTGVGGSKGLELKENEYYVEDLEIVDRPLYKHEDDAGAVNMWFEDTVGRKYKIKGVKKNLKRFWQRMVPKQSRMKKLSLLLRPLHG
jgi:hypothetical protein